MKETGVPRRVEPELLDALPPEDPRARRSRHDLRRVHRAMRSLSILKRAISGAGLEQVPRRIIELGAGDGSLMLRLARALNPPWTRVSLTLLDRNSAVESETIEAFRRLGWDARVVREDALKWRLEPGSERYDLCVATLFLHHFDDAELKTLLAAVSLGSRAFVACEPQRSAFARVGSRLIVLLGVNAVTREDSVKSVAAGFAGHELTALWPGTRGEWEVAETRVLPFTHCFTAVCSSLPKSSAAHVARR